MGRSPTLLHWFPHGIEPPGGRRVVLRGSAHRLQAGGSPQQRLRGGWLAPRSSLARGPRGPSSAAADAARFGAGAQGRPGRPRARCLRPLSSTRLPAGLAGLGPRCAQWALGQGGGGVDAAGAAPAAGGSAAAAPPPDWLRSGPAAARCGAGCGAAQCAAAHEREQGSIGSRAVRAAAGQRQPVESGALASAHARRLGAGGGSTRASFWLPERRAGCPHGARVSVRRVEALRRRSGGRKRVGAALHAPPPPGLEAPMGVPSAAQAGAGALACAVDVTVAAAVTARRDGGLGSYSRRCAHCSKRQSPPCRCPCFVLCYMHPLCTLSPFFSSGFSPPFPPSSLVSAVPGPVFLFQNTNRCNTVQYSTVLPKLGADHAAFVLLPG